MILISSFLFLFAGHLRPQRTRWKSWAEDRSHCSPQLCRQTCYWMLGRPDSDHWGNP